MKKNWQLVGRVIYWVALPALFVYLLIGKRTRVIICVDDEFLVVKGWLGSGGWQLPGGGLHRGEVSVCGALRELYEETGLHLIADDLALVQADVWSRGWFRFRFDVYVARLDHKPVITLQTGELVDYGWLPLSSASERLTPDTAQALKMWSFKR